MIRHDPGGAVFVIAKLGIGVEIPPPCDHAVEYLFAALCQACLQGVILEGHGIIPSFVDQIQVDEREKCQEQQTGLQ